MKHTDSHIPKREKRYMHDEKKRLNVALLIQKGYMAYAIAECVDLLKSRNNACLQQQYRT